MITYKEAKQILSRFAGVGGQCAAGDSLDLFCKKVFQYLLITGEFGSLRKFCFHAVKNCFVVPYEIENILKVKIEDSVGTVHNRWYEFHSAGDIPQCIPAANALYEEPNTFPTVYDLPDNFCRVGVLGTADEDVNAHIIVSGKDPTGREIVTTHQGNQINGEYLRIEKGKIRFTQVVFGQITDILKTKTVGYATLFWLRPELNTRGFLSDYSPNETAPAYRKFKITTPNCGPSVKVSVLAKIRIRDHYVDNDFLPFENLYALELAGQSLNSSYNGDVAMFEAKDKTLQDIIGRNNEYKKTNTGNPVDVYMPTSAGAIRNII